MTTRPVMMSAWVWSMQTPPLAEVSTHAWPAGQPVPALAQQSVTRTIDLVGFATGANGAPSNRPASRVLQQGDASALTTAWTYDAFGNVQTVQNTGNLVPTNNGTPLTVTTSYTNSGGTACTSGATAAVPGLFPSCIATPVYNGTTLNTFVETVVTEAMFGNEVSRTDINGLTTTRSYNVFGRLKSEARPDGTGTNIRYSYCSVPPTAPGGQPLPGGAVCPANAAYMIQVTPVLTSSQAPIGEQVRTYYDALDRPVRREGQQGLTGAATYADTGYDPVSGRTAAVSRPYLAGAGGASISNSAYTYDPLGRLIRLTHEDGSSITTQYAGRSPGQSTTVTDELAHATTLLRNSVA